MKLKRHILGGGIAALLLTTQTLLDAATITWTGGAITNNWTQDNNWSPSTQPPSDGTADLVFAGTTELNPDANNPWSIRSLTFASNAGAFVIIGQTLTIGSGGIRNNDNGRQFIGNAIVLGAPQTWDTIGTGELELSAVNTNGNLLTLQPVNGPGIGRVVISGTITGSGGLTKAGAGDAVFSGSTSNAYTGTTVVNAGRLLLQKTAGINAIAGDLVIGDGTGTDTVLIDLANQIANTSDVTVNSSGILDLDNNSETIASLTINGGTVTAFGAGGSLTVASLAMTGGTIGSAVSLTLGGNVSTNASASTATISADVDFNGATRTFTVPDGAAAIDLQIGGEISNGGLTKSGTGTLRLSGTTNNLHLLTTTVSGGVLELAKTGAVSALIGPLTINATATVRLAASNQLLDTVDVTINGGVLDLDGFNDTIDLLTMTGGSVFTGAGKLTVGGNIAATASSVSLAQITGNLDLGGATRTVTVADSATFAIDATFLATISNGGLVKAGPGTLRLVPAVGANTFAGGLTVNAGELAVGDNSAAGTGTLTLNTGATIRADTTARTLSNPVTLGGDFTIGGALDLTFTGPATLTGDRVLTIANSGITTFSGAIGQDVAGRGFTKAGSGTLRFSGVAANTYTGTTTVSGGTLELGKTAGVNAIAGPLVIDTGIVSLLSANQIADGSPVTITNGGFLLLSNLTETIGALTLMNASGVGGGGTLTLGGDVTTSAASTELLTNVNLGGATRTFNVADGPSALDLSVNGVVSNGGITKAGAGVLRLTATSSYTGATTVNGGTLLVVGSISGSTVTVTNDATLSGAGTTGAVTLATASSLAPGNSVGTLTTGNLTIGSGSSLRFELAAPGTVGGTVNDLVTVNGALTLDGTLVVTELAGFSNGTYRLFDHTGTLTDNGLDLRPAFLAAHPGSSITFAPNKVNLQVVPEPASAALCALSCVTVALRRRRPLFRCGS